MLARLMLVRHAEKPVDGVAGVLFAGGGQVGI